MARTVAGLLLCLQQLIASAVNDLTPAPKLRPADVTRFSASSVKIGPSDIEEIKSRLSSYHHARLAGRLTDKASLSVLATNVDALSELALTPSFKLQEWALHALGERSPIPSATAAKLLTVVTNTGTDEHIRALAARVMMLGNVDSATVGLLLKSVPGAPPELQVLLVELTGLRGSKAQPDSGQLWQLLAAPSGALQFHALLAIHRIENVGTNAPMSDVEVGSHLLRAAETGSPEARETAMMILQQVGSPTYLQCAALLALAPCQGTAPIVESILAKVGDQDSFVAQTGGNVLQRIRLHETAIPFLGSALISGHAQVRLHGAMALRRFGIAAAAASNAVAMALDRATEQGAPRDELIALLEVVRAMGTHGRALGPALATLLAEQSPIYRELPKGDVHHLRTWILVTMADIGAPKEGLPAMMDALANTEESGGMLFAAAARAAATLGPEAADAVPFLVRPFQNTIAEQFITFDAFGAHASASGEYTTCELEALKALQRIGPAAGEALPVLRAFVAQPLPALANSRRFKRVPHPQKEALKTIAVIEATTAGLGSLEP